MKKQYFRPVIVGLEPGSDPGVVIGGSQDEIGSDYSFDAKLLSDPTYGPLIASGDYELQYGEIDGYLGDNPDLYISFEEFDAWYKQSD